MSRHTPSAMPQGSQRLSCALAAVLAQPRGQQRSSLRALVRDLAGQPEPEAWNSSFGPNSLFDAWTRTTLMTGLHRSNRTQLLAALPSARPFVALEIGGGDGRLWAGALPADATGELWLVDPVPEVGARVASVLPQGVTLHFLCGRAEHLLVSLGTLPPVDVALCSLVLHHLAGRDQRQREHHGLRGPGKTELLQTLATALRPDGGLLVVNEADVHCDLDLAQGDDILSERLVDSYLRRCAQAILADVATRPDADEDLRERWRAVVLHWCLEQVELAARPVAERDIYELDVPRWRAVFAAAGLTVRGECFTDDWGLFRQYLLIPSPT